MRSLRVWKLRDYQKWKSISSWMSMMNILRSSVMELTKPWRKFCQMKNIRPVELILHFPLDTYYVRWVLIQFFFLLQFLRHREIWMLFCWMRSDPRFTWPGRFQRKCTGIWWDIRSSGAVRGKLTRCRNSQQWGRATFQTF